MKLRPANTTKGLKMFTASQCIHGVSRVRAACLHSAMTAVTLEIDAEGGTFCQTLFFEKTPEGAETARRLFCALGGLAQDEI